MSCTTSSALPPACWITRWMKCSLAMAAGGMVGYLLLASQGLKLLYAVPWPGQSLYSTKPVPTEPCLEVLIP